MEMAGGALAGGVLSGCAPRLTRGKGQAVTGLTLDPMTATDFQSARRYVHTRYGKIAYVERGDGDVALFLHGFPLNGFQWRGALDRLSAHRRCIPPDFLRSATPRSPPARASHPTHRSRCSSPRLHTSISRSTSRQRQRRGGCPTPRHAVPRARAHADADELRRGDRQPATRAPPCH